MKSERSSGTRLFLTAAGLLLLVLAFLIGRWTGVDERGDPTPRTSVAESEAERLINGVPVGYPRSQEGAIEAATNFTRVMASALENPETYREVLLTMASPSWISEAERIAENGLRFFQERYGLGGTSTFSPLRYRVESYSNGRATIQIWGVTVAAGPKVDGIDESWLTGTVDLSWVEGDWRISEQSSEAGPTPELLQSGTDLSTNALEGFKDYPRAPRP